MSDGPTTVGSINAKLVLDVDEFMRRSEEAAAEADKLDGRKVNIKADADTAGAEAKLAELSAAEDKAARSVKVKTEAQQGEFSMMQLLIGASPALLGATAALGAATVGLGVAFGGTALAGIAAFAGIRQEIAAGTPVGMTYANGIHTISSAFQELSRIPAPLMVQSFDSAVQNVNQHMPLLAGITRDASSALGNMGSMLVSGLMRALTEMRPLIDAGLIGIQNLVHWISAVPASGGFQQFVKYAIDNLPATISLVENLVGAVIHLTTSVAPMGPVVISVLNGVTSAIQAIPAPVLGTLTTLALGAFGAFKLWGGIAPIIESVGSALSFAATRIELAIPVVGILTAGVTLLTQVMGDSAASTRNAAAATDDYTNSIRLDGDALGQHTKQQIIDNLAKTDAIKIGKEAGLTAADLANAILDGGSAAEYVTQRVKAHSDALGTAGSESLDWANKAQTLYGILGSSTDRVKEQTQAVKEDADAKKAAAAADTTQTMYLDKLAGGLGTTTDALNTARSSQTDVGAQAAQTTLQMQLQNNAAGLLKQGLDALNTGALTLAQSETATWSSINSATDALKNNKGAINGHSEAAVADQQALQGVASAAQTQAQKVAESTGSTQKGIDTYKDAKKALEDQMRSQGLLSDSVQGYIDKIFDVNNLQVKPTKLEVDKSQADAAIAELQTQLDNMTTRKVIDIVTRNSTINTTSSDTGLYVGNGADPQAHALGGWITPAYFAGGGQADPYARGTDTVHAMLTPGEFTVQRSSAQALERDYPGALGYMNRTGQLPPQQQAALPPIYVQNPWTGEYMLAQYDTRAGSIAQGVVEKSWEDASRKRVGGV